MEAGSKLFLNCHHIAIILDTQLLERPTKSVVIMSLKKTFNRVYSMSLFHGSTGAFVHPYLSTFW